MEQKLTKLEIKKGEDDYIKFLYQKGLTPWEIYLRLETLKKLMKDFKHGTKM